ncbi:hypothetical protein CMV_016421 [Castanea mollissima]|uniref:Uncharacterized protein n=1 Tax=Castanea mollissima TaxID=60419 RepID=A0A8J4QTT9_9ROSI|nr:hypothetical protein CMV_016421 [Castanea mollissima]
MSIGLARETNGATSTKSSYQIILPALDSMSLKANCSNQKDSAKLQEWTSTRPVVSASLNPMRSIKGTPSSVAIGKRKRQDEKLKVISKEEAAALKAREAAKKRVEETGKTIVWPLQALFNLNSSRNKGAQSCCEDLGSDNAILAHHLLIIRLLVRISKL